MQRIALIADIHGNLPALHAVFADIDRRGIQRVFCLGDLVGKGPQGSAVVDLCRTRCEVIILGNWDALLSRPQEAPSFAWWRNELGAERCDWLGSLPFHFDFVLSGRNVRLLHSSPESVFQRVFQSADRDQLLRMFAPGEHIRSTFAPDMVIYADLHAPFMRTFPDRMLINVGSVGNPIHGTDATYVVLEGDVGSSQDGPWGYQFVQIPYDIEACVRATLEMGAPERDAWSFELRTGRNRRELSEDTTIQEKT